MQVLQPTLSATSVPAQPLLPRPQPPSRTGARQLAQCTNQSGWRLTLLGIQVQDATFIDTALPFGLRSAPKIFSAFSDALAWVLHARGVAWQLHYLDDFLFMGPPGSASCARALQVTVGGVSGDTQD